MPLPFIGTFVCLSEYNINLSEKFNYSEVIPKLPLLDSLLLISRIDLLLSKEKYGDNTIQKKIISLLFKDPNHRDVMNSLLEEKDNSVIFHHQQIYYLMSLLLRHSDQTVSYKDINEEILYNIGLLLLYINDELRIAYGPVSPDSLAGHFWRLGHLVLSTQRDSEFGAEFARTHILFNDFKNSTDLSKKFREITGISLNKFLQVGFSIYTHVINQSEDKLITSDFILKKDEYFKNFVNLSRDDINISLSLLSNDLLKLRRKHRQYISHFNADTYNFESIREAPLLEFKEGLYVCLSLPYLVLRITRELPEIIRSIYHNNTYANEIGALKGKVSEDYLLWSSQKAFQPVSVERARIAKNRKFELADLILDYGTDLVFIESKALNIQKRYRLQNTKTSIRNGVSNFLLKKGAKQLSKNIQYFMKGDFKIKDINPANIEHFWPVLITFNDDLPIHPFLVDVYNELMKQKRFFKSRRILNLSILSIEEYDRMLDIITHEGLTFIELLGRRLNKKEYSSMSVRNYLFSENLTTQRYFTESWLGDRFKSLMKEYIESIES